MVYIEETNVVRQYAMVRRSSNFALCLPLWHFSVFSALGY